MKKYWSEFINRYDSFTYVFRIPITSENYQCQILDLDISFLKYGEQFKLFFFDQIDLIENYKKYRNEKFLCEDKKRIGLIDFEQYEKNLWKQMQISLPEVKENEIKLVNKSFLGLYDSCCIINIENTTDLNWSDFEELNRWERTASFAIYSTSNIWWDKIDFTRFENEIYPQELDKPVDNRPFSYRITPRFNSFLRKMKSKVQELGGKVILEEYISKHVTEDGILLDGKIIYQEDIDEGRVQLP